MSVAVAAEARPIARAARWTTPQTGGLRHPLTRELRHIGGTRGLPLLGAMPEILLDPQRFSERMVAAHGRVYRFHALGKWHVHLTGPEANELLLFDSEGSFSAEEGWGPLVAPLLPGALLITDGAEHRRRRRVLGEAFKQAELSGYQSIFASDMEERFGGWEGRRIDAYREIKRLTFRIAASTFLGVSLGEEAERAMGYFGRIAGGLLSISYNPRLSPARARGLAGKARLEQLLFRLIEEKRKCPGADFLSRISSLKGEDGALLEAREIADAFIFLLVAAHDTMSSALTSTLYFLAAHPEWAERLRGELASAGVGDPIEAASARLPLHEMFYKETVRLNSAAPMVWRRAVRTFSIYGLEIPAGTMTGANLMMSHKLPDIWPEPDRFDPFRFTPEQEKARHRFAFVPFGAGVHKCLGMHFSQQQARIFTAHLLLNADLRLVGERSPGWYQWPNCRPRRPFRVEVSLRYRGR